MAAAKVEGSPHCKRMTFAFHLNRAAAADVQRATFAAFSELLHSQLALRPGARSFPPGGGHANYCGIKIDVAQPQLAPCEQ